MRCNSTHSNRHRPLADRIWLDKYDRNKRHDTRTETQMTWHTLEALAYLVDGVNSQTDDVINPATKYGHLTDVWLYDVITRYFRFRSVRPLLLLWQNMTRTWAERCMSWSVQTHQLISPEDVRISTAEVRYHLQHLSGDGQSHVGKVAGSVDSDRL